MSRPSLRAVLDELVADGVLVLRCDELGKALVCGREGVDGEGNESISVRLKS